MTIVYDSEVAESRTNGEYSATSSGDSGGPMFNSLGELVGVTSGGFTRTTTSGTELLTVGLFVTLRATYSISVLDESKNSGADIPTISTTR